MKDYIYNFGNVKRKCGHTEKIDNYKTSYACKSTVRGWLENCNCSTCAKKETELRRQIEAINYAKAEAYLKAHGIEHYNITAYEDGVDIQICISREDLTPPTDKTPWDKLSREEQEMLKNKAKSLVK